MKKYDINGRFNWFLRNERSLLCNGAVSTGRGGYLPVSAEEILKDYMEARDRLELLTKTVNDMREFIKTNDVVAGLIGD
jgi:capsule polysaccharide export protein KpsE/RkpR